MFQWIASSRISKGSPKNSLISSPSYSASSRVRYAFRPKSLLPTTRANTFVGNFGPESYSYCWMVSGSGSIRSNSGSSIGFLLPCSWHENLPDDPHGRWVGQIVDSSFKKLDFFLAMADNITVTRLAEQTSHHPRLVVVVDGEPTGLA